MTRIWIDGCFDFAHHGHAGAMLQARQEGTELYVGVHNDEDILINKGPSVMKQDERVIAVEGCRWCTKCIPDAPYVTDPAFMDQYGCKYVVHGDDITTDKDGNDCYAEVKQMGRFIVVKRTPNISTTDLVGRMLSGDKDHHIKRVDDQELANRVELLNDQNIERYKLYATDQTGKNPFANVWVNVNDKLHTLVKGQEIKDRKVYFVDGSFDLFHPGHILFLKKVKEIASEDNGVVVVGIWDDETINSIKGSPYPIMNIFERSLCVLQSKYIDGIILGSPLIVSGDYISQLGNYEILHGTSSIRGQYPVAAKIVSSPSMSVQDVVSRVLGERAAFEERQRRKGYKKEEEKLVVANNK